MNRLYIYIAVVLAGAVSNCAYATTQVAMSAQSITAVTQSNTTVELPCINNDLHLAHSYSVTNTTKLTQIKNCAEQDHAQFQYIYGNILYNSLYNGHIDNTLAQAANWWTKAGQQGYGDAWYRLGLLFQQGFGDEVESRAGIVKAADYFTLGANAGSSHAQYYLGIALFRGWGIEQDKKLAMQWWKKAADNGYQPAKNAFTGSVAIKWYPEKNSPIWQLFNQVNNKSKAEFFTFLTGMIPYKNDTELEQALAHVNYPEPQYFNMYIDIYQVLKHLPSRLEDMPHCAEFKKILQNEYSGELNSYFDSELDGYSDDSQINSALWYALQRVCVPDAVEEIEK